MADLNTLIDNLEAKFNADAADDMEDIFQFDITDGEAYYLDIKDGKCDMHKGTHDAPSVTLILDTETATAILSGEISGMQAFMGGKLRVEGDMMLSTKFDSLFELA